jgi:hypothetical protein
MKFATESHFKQILVWLIWAITIFVFISTPEHIPGEPAVEPPALVGIVTHHRRDGPLFPWKYHLRVLGRHRRRALRRTCHRVVWVARLAKLALRGALTMAQIVDSVDPIFQGKGIAGAVIS